MTTMGTTRSLTKKLLDYNQLAEKYALSVKNAFFSHSHAS